MLCFFAQCNYYACSIWNSSFCETYSLVIVYMIAAIIGFAIELSPAMVCVVESANSRTTHNDWKENYYDNRFSNYNHNFFRN